MVLYLAGKRLTNKEEIKSIQWSTWTCVLGTEVNGIWDKYTDTNDVNATDACFQHNVLVTGDDFGLVKLFKFPTVRKGIYLSFESDFFFHILHIHDYVNSYTFSQYYYYYYNIMIFLFVFFFSCIFSSLFSIFNLIVFSFSY